MNISILGHVAIDHNISEKIEYTGAGSPAMFMTKIFSKLSQANFQIIAPYGTDFLPYIKNISIYPEKPIGDKTLIYENKPQGNIRT